MSDYPDDFGFPQFPSYGAAAIKEGSTNCPGSGTTTLFTISGKGIAFGGYLYTIDPAANANSAVLIYIDGALWMNELISNLRYNGLGGGVANPLVVTYYDVLDGEFTVALSGNITFMTSLVLKFTNAVASAIVVYFKLAYTLIE